MGDVLAAMRPQDEHTARAAAALSRSSTKCWSPSSIPSPPQRAQPHRSIRDTRTPCRTRSSNAATPRPRWPPAPTWSAAPGRPSASSTSISSPRVPWPNLSDGGRFKLFTQGQGIFDDRRQVASVLGIEKDQLEVELVPNGGAFGGKEDMSIQAQTALLAQMTGPTGQDHAQPRRVASGCTPNVTRSPCSTPWAAMRDGRLTAVMADMVGDTGAYASVGSKVLERAAGHSCGPYKVPNVLVEARAVHTNNPPCGAMRGFGANQAHFAIDGALDLLAAEVGSRRLGDPLAQRCRCRRPRGHGPDPREVRRHQADPGSSQEALLRSPRDRVVPSASAAA